MLKLSQALHRNSQLQYSYYKKKVERALFMKGTVFLNILIWLFYFITLFVIFKNLLLGAQNFGFAHSSILTCYSPDSNCIRDSDWIFEVSNIFFVAAGTVSSKLLHYGCQSISKLKFRGQYPWLRKSKSKFQSPNI